VLHYLPLNPPSPLRVGHQTVAPRYLASLPTTYHMVRLEARMQVNILESKNHLSQLIRRAQEGEEVIIAHRGVPVVKLVPMGAVVEKPGRDVLAWLRRHPLPAALQRSAEEIDRAIAQERQGRD
jgi:prevent-host-death family protein